MRKLLIISVLVVIALAIIDLAYDPGYRADAVCPMANRNIEWHYLQSKNPR